MKKSLKEAVANTVIQCIGCTDGDHKFSTVCKCYVGVASLLVPWSNLTIVASVIAVNQNIMSLWLFSWLNLVVKVGTNLWDPGGHYYIASIISHFFKIWDPRGSLTILY